MYLHITADKQQRTVGIRLQMRRARSNGLKIRQQNVLHTTAEMLQAIRYKNYSEISIKNFVDYNQRAWNISNFAFYSDNPCLPSVSQQVQQTVLYTTLNTNTDLLLGESTKYRINIVETVTT